MTYYIYEVPGEKNGATINWDKRSQENFDMYSIWPIIVETMEGPNTPEMWQVVGDREWELADLNGYRRGTHYRFAREKRPVWDCKPTKEAAIAGGRVTGRKHVESGHLARVRDPKKATESSLRRIVCEHCSKDANTGNYARWHGDNCKHKKSL